MQQISSAMQDYIKAIYLEAERRGGEGLEGSVSTTGIADRLGVSAASATNMLKKLAALGLVDHVPYRGADLTPQGSQMALEMIRHHRLLETYLSEALGVPWDQIHEEAEVLEHVLSEDLEQRIADRLGDPRIDPHGHPIPSKDGKVPEVSGRSLWEVPTGESVQVERVSDAEPEALRYLGTVGIRPGESVVVVGRGPVDGPLFLRVRSRKEAISKRVAEAVWVS